MVGLINTRADLDGSNQKIAGDDKREVALYGRLERSTDDSGVVDSRDRGGDIEFRVGIVEEFNRDSGKRPGSSILENVKKRRVEFNLSIPKHPGLLWHRRLGDRGRSRSGVPQAFRCRGLSGPRHLADQATQYHGEEHMSELVNR
jgi:hypothetical protein